MANTFKAAFPQAPKIGQATITSANTALDGSGTITSIISAGSNGMKLVGLEAHARATVTATSVRIFLSQDAGSTWTYLFDALIPAHTVANTTENAGKIIMIDRGTEADVLEVPADAVIGATIAVALAGGITVTGYGEDY